jgi:hypothetical protein
MEKLWRCSEEMLEEVDITTDGKNLPDQSPFSLHAISIISPQVVCTLGVEISIGDAKVSRM